MSALAIQAGSGAGIAALVQHQFARASGHALIRDMRTPAPQRLRALTLLELLLVVSIMAILAALWDGKLYGLEILRRMESDSDLIVTEGTIYPLLSRLKALGLVRSEWVESDAGHPRKYYALTPAGRHRLRASSGAERAYCLCRKLFAASGAYLCARSSL